MVKEAINFISQPQYSFTLAMVLFFLGCKYYRFVGSKKFGLWTLVLSVGFYIWAILDPTFALIIFFPDNVPISILLATVGFFTWFSMHKAAENDARLERGEPPIEGTPENREKVWCWPNLVYTEMFTIILGTVFLIAWAIVFKAPLEEPANPTWAPNPAKAPWYFLGLQEMLVYFDPWLAGVVLPVLIIVGLVAIPYIDTNPKGNGYYCWEDRKLAIIAFNYGWLVLWLFLIIIGTFLRGPNWTFYGPFEYWDSHKVVAEYNVNLSELLWIKFLNMRMPSNILLRESLGIAVTFFYLFGFIPLLKKCSLTIRQKMHDLYTELGFIRYYLLLLLVLGTASLPIKMYLRWLFTLKYIVALPEWELNI